MIAEEPVLGAGVQLILTEEEVKTLIAVLGVVGNPGTVAALTVVSGE